MAGFSADIAAVSGCSRAAYSVGITPAEAPLTATHYFVREFSRFHLLRIRAARCRMRSRATPGLAQPSRPVFVCGSAAGLFLPRTPSRERCIPPPSAGSASARPGRLRHIPPVPPLYYTRCGQFRIVQSGQIRPLPHPSMCSRPPNRRPRAIASRAASPGNPTRRMPWSTVSRYTFSMSFR